MRVVVVVVVLVAMAVGRAGGFGGRRDVKTRV